jgi:hypothetical protein
LSEPREGRRQIRIRINAELQDGIGPGKVQVHIAPQMDGAGQKNSIRNNDMAATAGGCPVVYLTPGKSM